MTDKDEAIEPAYKTFVRNSRGEIVMEHAWFSTTQVNQLICRAIEAERAKQLNKTQCEKCGAYLWRRDDGVLGACTCIDPDKIYILGE